MFGERTPIIREEIVLAISEGFTKEELPTSYLQDWIRRQISTADLLEKVSDLVEREIGKPSVSGGHTDADGSSSGSESSVS